MTGVTHRFSKLWKQNTKTLRLEKKKKEMIQAWLFVFRIKTQEVQKGYIGNEWIKI